MKQAKQFIVFLATAIFSCAIAHADGHVSVQGDMALIEGEGVKAGAVSTELIRVTAKVVGIDYSDRVVVLEGGEGDYLELEVSEEARNFDQVQVGDKVAVEYLESVALFATEPGSGESASVAGAVAVAAEGEMPGAVVTEAVQITAVVQEIDYETRTVTMKGPRGVSTLSVDERATRFENIKVGDEVHFVYTEAMAISVSKVEE